MAEKKDSELVSPKVTFATGGALGGYGLGKALSTILIYYWIGNDAPADVKLAIELLCEGGLAAVTAFVAGYNKGEPARNRADRS